MGNVEMEPTKPEKNGVSEPKPDAPVQNGTSGKETAQVRIYKLINY
jgi:hypothetical protein